jgi:hypothetical protein
MRLLGRLNFVEFGESEAFAPRNESLAFSEGDQCASMPALDAVVLPVKFKSIPQEGHTQDVQRCGGIKISAWAPSCSTI